MFHLMHLQLRHCTCLLALFSTVALGSCSKTGCSSKLISGFFVKDTTIKDLRGHLDDVNVRFDKLFDSLAQISQVDTSIQTVRVQLDFGTAWGIDNRTFIIEDSADQWQCREIRYRVDFSENMDTISVTIESVAKLTSFASWGSIVDSISSAQFIDLTGNDSLTSMSFDMDGDSYSIKFYRKGVLRRTVFQGEEYGRYRNYGAFVRSFDLIDSLSTKRCLYQSCLKKSISGDLKSWEYGVRDSMLEAR